MFVPQDDLLKVNQFQHKLTRAYVQLSKLNTWWLLPRTSM